MKNVSRITQSLIIAALCSTGVAMAQSGTASSTQPTTPSNTPNESTGAQPNKPLQPGTQAPAPSETTTPMKTETNRSHGGQMSGTHGDGRGKAPSDAGNTNVSPTQNMQGGSAPYTPSQK